MRLEGLDTLAPAGDRRARRGGGRRQAHQRGRAAGVRAQDRLAFAGPLERDHHVGAHAVDLHALERAAEIALHETGGVDEHTLTALGQRAGHQARGGLGGLAQARRRRRHAEELELAHLDLVEALDRTADTAETDGGRRADVGLAEIGVDDGDGVAAPHERGGEARHQRALAGVAGPQHQGDPGGGGGLEGRRRRFGHASDASAAPMRASPSLISASLVA